MFSKSNNYLLNTQSNASIKFDLPSPSPFPLSCSIHQRIWFNHSSCISPLLCQNHGESSLLENPNGLLLPNKEAEPGFSTCLASSIRYRIPRILLFRAFKSSLHSCNSDLQPPSSVGTFIPSIYLWSFRRWLILRGFVFSFQKHGHLFFIFFIFTILED